MIVGALGDFVFGERVIFNSLQENKQAKLFSHDTIDGLPIIESSGLEPCELTIGGALVSELSGDLDEIIGEMQALMDGQARPFSRGRRHFGMFIVRSLQISEELWVTSQLVSASWQMQLVQTRG